MSMPHSKRFQDSIQKFGFKIRKVPFRPDILSVQFMNKHLMTIPKRMYSRPSPKHLDMGGLEHPDYFECERQSIGWNARVKRTPYLEEDWMLEREQKDLWK